ncbi:MAG: 3-deoxy-manno-octulosonate cytidylyltransferase [Candidatus Omnitrophica bacterium]|nr:3-deoxy-manno-octulosonate cytidylyltransferase [Candidatus Omnitrophota bacterium]
MKIIGVIPARWASTRLPGKPLADIAGKPMIQRVWEQAKKSRRLNEVLVACDDSRIEQAVKAFGGQAVMTDPNHPSGTDRIAEAVQGRDADGIINIQGDEPLIDPRVIDALAGLFSLHPGVDMATVIKRIMDEKDYSNPNVVKVVVNQRQEAVYFSRSPIPFNRDGGPVTAYKHLGIYAYQKNFLLGYKNLPESLLEKTEKLEQLRAIEAGYKIKTVITDMESMGVDTAEDLEKIRHIINTR